MAKIGVGYLSSRLSWVISSIEAIESVSTICPGRITFDKYLGSAACIVNGRCCVEFGAKLLLPRMLVMGLVFSSTLVEFCEAKETCRMAFNPTLGCFFANKDGLSSMGVFVDAGASTGTTKEAVALCRPIIVLRLEIVDLP